MDTATLLTAASLIGAFGTSVLVFRIQRELQVAEAGRRNWIPWADRLMVVATVVSFAVVASLLSFGSTLVKQVSSAGLAGAAVLSAGYPPAILAHYRLLPGPKGKGEITNPEPMERVLVFLAVLVALGAALAAFQLACGAAYEPLTRHPLAVASEVDVPDTSQAPFWAAPALLAAVIAVLGFIGKTAADLVLRLRESARERKSRLTELYALLRAGDVAFAVQQELRKRLADQLRHRLTETADLSPGFDRLFAATYAVMNQEERQLHLLIRNMTVHTFQPLNESLLEWLRADRYFRAVPPSHRRLGHLALFLAQLEAHLILWVAKYEAWIPDHPEHALVFLADEERHGVGFPKNGSTILAKVLGHPTPTGGG